MIIRLKILVIILILGFGFRAVSGEVVAYSHSNEISKNSLKQSSENLKSTLNQLMAITISLFLNQIKNIMKVLIQ